MKTSKKLNTLTTLKTLKKDRNYYLAVIYLLICVVFWGCSFISTKVVLKEIPPVSIAFFRQIIASTILFGWIFSTRSFIRVKIRHFGLMALAGLFGIVLYFLFENTGLLHTSAFNASIIIAAVPIFTASSEAIFFKTKIGVKMIGCILLSIVGVYLVISAGGKIDFSSKTFYGNMLMVGAMLVWVIYIMINKTLSGKYPAVNIIAYQTLISIFLFIPFILSEIKSWIPISSISIFNLLFLGIFCSACGYYLYFYAIKVLGAAISSAFLNLIPVVSVICGYFVLGEKVTPIQIGGMIIVLTSLYWMNTRNQLG